MACREQEIKSRTWEFNRKDSKLESPVLYSVHESEREINLTLLKGRKIKLAFIHGFNLNLHYLYGVKNLGQNI